MENSDRSRSFKDLCWIAIILAIATGMSAGTGAFEGLATKNSAVDTAIGGMIGTFIGCYFVIFIGFTMRLEDFDRPYYHLLPDFAIKVLLFLPVHLVVITAVAWS